MTALQIRFDGPLAEAIREKAQQAGKTPEAWATDVVALQAAPKGTKEWIHKFLESAKTSPGNSRGWKWNRNEIYEQ